MKVLSIAYHFIGLSQNWLDFLIGIFEQIKIDLWSLYAWFYYFLDIFVEASLIFRVAKLFWRRDQYLLGVYIVQDFFTRVVLHQC